MTQFANIDPSNEIQEQLVGSILDWVQTLFGYTDEELPEKVAFSSRGPAKSPRTSLPFLVFFFPVHDIPVGMSERLPLEDGYALTSGKMGTVSFIGYGEGANELCRRLKLGTQPELIPDNITIEDLGPIIDISEFDETAIEPRYTVDFAIIYRLTTDEAVIPQSWATKVTNTDTGQEYP